MPIKKSFLEKKWYYRVAKTLFLILPLLIAATFFIMGKININFLFQDQKVIVDTLQENVVYIVYAVLAVVAYYVLINLVWKIILYIFFGGLENDTKKEVKGAIQPASQIVQSGGMSSEDKKQVGFYIFVLIMIILVYFIVTYQGFVPNPFPSPTPGPKCVPTGCGNLWYSSCTKKCYSTNGDCRTASQKCSSFMCRQCP